ncbi:MAG: RagB/SusD family nutrient uptake outer membrane protein [Prevotella sp.]|nr:RagB/SusD family nutrient uptake outer membrane protein [Prevotella sp.]MBR6088150.1 RagB/SusD family nutrient uptake outer membrane protein [Prevotella sp.]
MKKIFSIILASIALTSCVDTVILPENKTVDDDFWKKKSEVSSVVSAAYAQLRDQVAIRNMIIWGDFRSDELVVTSALPASTTPAKNLGPIALAQVYSLNIEPDNVFTSWYPFYSAINYCNLVLEKAEGVVAVDPDYTMDDYLANRAQALALRAFCYFYLTKVFHDIPITPGAYMESSADLNAPQATPDSVLNMCINDLKEAEQYAVSNNIYGDWRDKGYLNKDGINAILADIYLWRASINRDASDYQACVDCCDKIIKAKKEAYEQDPSKRRRFGQDTEEKDYYLSAYNTMYSDLFGQNGQNADESIFELQFKLSSANNTGFDQMYFRYRNRSADSYGYLKASSKYGTVDGTGNGVWINNADQRLYEFLYDAASSSVEQFAVRKGVATTTSGLKTADSKRDPRTTVYQNWILYRLTDVMLMKAEALVQLYNLAGKAETDTRNEEAFAICQFVNDRALSDEDKSSFTLKYSTYKDRMEELVLAERARELCFEGKRYFDLMRYNYRHTSVQADLSKHLFDEDYQVVTNNDDFLTLLLRKYPAPSAMKSKIRDERNLYMPINLDETEINTNLVQNPVYKSSTKY